MRRVLVAGGTIVLLSAIWMGTANAADCQQSLLGLVCTTVQGTGDVLTTVTDSTGKVISSATTPIPTPAPVTVTVPGPVRTVSGPTKTVQVPGPTHTVTASPSTKTVTASATPAPGSTATVTAAPSTVTITAPGQTNAPAGQTSRASATVAPTLATPPAEEPSSPVSLLPHSPASAAVQGSFIGLLVGVFLGFIGLYIAYRRGKKDGEEATLVEFLHLIQGKTGPAPRGRHRLVE